MITTTKPTSLPATSPSPVALKGNTDVSRDFIRQFTEATGAKTICLVAIIPDGAPETRTFDAGDDAQREWIEARQDRCNMYFTPNTVRGRPTKKPGKRDMLRADVVWADLDPRPGADFESERERINNLTFSLQFSDAEPSFVIDSGGGFQLFWLLAEPIPLDGKDGSATRIAETLGRRLGKRLAGDAVQNCDRIMRLPGTINLPNAKKRAQGRNRALATLRYFDSNRYTVEKIRDLSAWQLEETTQIDGDLRNKLARALAADDRLFFRWHGDSDGLKDASRSGFDMSIGAHLKGHGFTMEEIGQILRQAFTHGVGPELADRQIDRMFNNSVMPEGAKVEKTPQRDQLLAIGLGAELWHDGRGEPYATIRHDSHVEHFPIDGTAFKNWLLNEFMGQHGRPSAPSATSVGEALAAIKARASRGPKRETFVRVGEHGGKVYLDLGSEKWDAIEIDADDWRIVDTMPLPMVRYAGMEPLPYPTRGGSIEALRPYLNLPSPSHDDMFKLVVGYCLASLFPRGPFMVLNFAGEMGSLKSAATWAIKRTIDPNRVNLRTKPRSEDDLLISAERNHLLAFENCSSISEDLSDQLCRLATGGGLAKRTLFTTKEETLLTACKPVLINGIPDIVTRDDLADRAIVCVLPPFKGRRRADEEVRAEFDTKDRPAILGALLDGVSRALGRYRAVELPEGGPRMADFAKRAIAAFPTFGWTEGEFMRVWREYRAHLAEKSIQSDSMSAAIRQFMAAREKWEGRPEELLNEIECNNPRDKQWPTTGHYLCNRLRRSAPMLRACGIDIDLERKHPTTRRRIITITKAAS